MRRNLILALVPLALAGSLLNGCTPASTTTSATPVPMITATLGDTKTLAFTMKKWMVAQPDPQVATDTVAVNGTFPTFTVTLSKKSADIKKPADLTGLTAKVEVPLADTNVITGSNSDALLRNGRIAAIYFEADKYAKAGFTLSNFQTTSTKETFAAGDALDVTADAELDLHGIKKTIAGVKLGVTLTDSGCRIKSAQDLSIKSDDFALPWQALIAECKHKGLDEAATVSFDVTLQN